MLCEECGSRRTTKQAVHGGDLEEDRPCPTNSQRRNIKTHEDLHFIKEGDDPWGCGGADPSIREAVIITLVQHFSL